MIKSRITRLLNLECALSLVPGFFVKIELGEVDNGDFETAVPYPEIVVVIGWNLIICQAFAQSCLVKAVTEINHDFVSFTRFYH